MNKLKLGTTDIEVPSIVLGCMRFSDKGEKEMNDYIHFALDRGVNFFDHANIYGGGMCEDIFGRAFSSDISPVKNGIHYTSRQGTRCLKDS